MADEVKEGLTQEADVEASQNDSTEENVDDYFNPFADITDEDKQIEKDIAKEDDGEDEVEQEVSKPVESDVRSELAEVKAERQASKEVSAFVREHPEFEEMSDELIDLASKATVRGHSKPLEFAVRNIKSPNYWIDYGKKVAREDLASVAQNRVGGASIPKGGKSSTPDFNSMSSEEFNEYYRSVVSNA
jgi:hypothetical protein